MKKSLLIGLLSALALGSSMTTAHASVVNVKLVSEGTSVPYHGVYAGEYLANIDTILSGVVCDDALHIIHNGDSWQANRITYTDMQNGISGRFADLVKYSQVSWLFDQMLTAATPTIKANEQAAIWAITSPSAGIPLDPLALSYFNQATDGSHNLLNWSATMDVLRPTQDVLGQEFLVRAAPVPAPPAYMLFLSGLVVLTGYVRKAKSQRSV